MTDNVTTQALATRTDELLRQLQSLMDVAVRVSIELGRAELTVRDLARLRPGYVLEVRKIAGEPLDVRFNGKVLARGEIVAADQSAGVRLVEISRPGAAS